MIQTGMTGPQCYLSNTEHLANWNEKVAGINTLGLDELIGKWFGGAGSGNWQGWGNLLRASALKYKGEVNSQLSCFSESKGG